MTQSTLVHRDVQQIPRAILRAAGVMVVGSILVVGAARLTGLPPAAMPPEAGEVQSRMIRIAGDGAGGVIVTDTATGAVIADLAMAKAGFIAGVDRALNRERMKRSADPDLPVRLVRWADGRLSLIDPATGWRVELMGFGPDNLDAFARLLGPAGQAQGGE